jgi:hypothetical protein
MFSLQTKEGGVKRGRTFIKNNVKICSGLRRLSANIIDEWMGMYFVKVSQGLVVCLIPKFSPGHLPRDYDNLDNASHL